MCVNTLCCLAFRHCQDFLRKTKAVLYAVVRVMEMPNSSKYLGSSLPSTPTKAV